MTRIEMIELLDLRNTRELQALIWYVETMARRDYSAFLARLCDNPKTTLTLEDLKKLSENNSASEQRLLDEIVALVRKDKEKNNAML